jgi:hypothetical protein
MKDHVTVSMRSASGSAREIMQEVTACGAYGIQLDATHNDFLDLTLSGTRDLAATLRRTGLRATGIDFLIPPTVWVDAPDQTLQAFSDAVAIAEGVGNVPVGTCLPDDPEITTSALTIGHRCGVLVSIHGVVPPQDPHIGWHLPVSLLAKEIRPMKTLAEAPLGPMAVRLKGDVVGESTLEFEGNQVELLELRGVMDAMRWSPLPIVYAIGDQAKQLIQAWHVAGPW